MNVVVLVVLHTKCNVIPIQLFFRNNDIMNEAQYHHQKLYFSAWWKSSVRKLLVSGVRGRFDQPFTWSFSRRRMAIRDILQEQDTAYGLWYLIPMSAAMLLMVAWVILATHPYPQAGSENALLLLLLLRRSSSIATILYASCARNFAVVVNLKFAAGCSQSLFMFVCL